MLIGRINFNLDIQGFQKYQLSFSLETSLELIMITRLKKILYFKKRNLMHMFIMKFSSIYASLLSTSCYRYTESPQKSSATVIFT